MELVTNDPELAQEMVHLLFKKLQKARRERDELRASRKQEGLLVDSSALQSENERLRNELANMRFTVNVTLGCDGETDLVMSRHTRETPEQEHVEPADLLSQRPADDLNAAACQVAELQGLAEKADAYKLKCKESRMKKIELEKDQSQSQQSLRTRKVELESTMRQLRDVESELEKARALIEYSSDISSFLSTAVEVPGCPRAGVLRAAGLPHHMIVNMKSDSLNNVVVLSGDVLWHENLNRAIVLVPAMHYDPTKRSGKGSWSPTHWHRLLLADGSTQVEVIYQSGSNCYYYGTYVTVLATSIPVAEAQKLSYSVAQHARDSLVLHRDQVAPAVSKLVDSLFAAGGLSVTCFAIQRVGFKVPLNAVT